MRKTDFILVGQGLAGTLLADALEERGKDVVVVDDGHRSSSSMVAAGMWNPVSFKTLNTVWMAEELLSEMQVVYPRLEKKLGLSFFHPAELIRIFPDTTSANDWDTRSTSSSWLGDPAVKSIQGIRATHGIGSVPRAGWINIAPFLKKFRSALTSSDRLIEEPFDPGSVQSQSGSITYRGIQAERLVFCTGAREVWEPWFGNVPVRPNKGEVLTVHLPGVDENLPINFGRFILPLGSGAWKLGATYSLEADVEGPTEQAREELIHDLGSVFAGEAEVLDHVAGLRPTTPDRRPVIGNLSGKNPFGIFSGFGSRGVMLIPWFAKRYAEELTSGVPGLPEVAWTRFSKLK